MRAGLMTLIEYKVYAWGRCVKRWTWGGMRPAGLSEQEV